MDINQVDAAIRIAAATTALLLAWHLGRQIRQIGLPAILFAPLAICLCGFLIGNTPVFTLRPAGIAGSAFSMLSGFTVIFLWWFCLSCFDRQFKLKGGVLWIGLAWATVAALDRGLFGEAWADRGWSVLLVTLGFGIIGHLSWRLIAERPGDLIEERHNARILVAVLLGGMLFIDLAVDMMFGFAWRPRWFAMTQNVMIFAFGLWLSGKLLTIRSAQLTFGVTNSRTPPRRNDTRNDELLRRLTALMEEQRIFLDQELTFGSFVARMNAPERVVRKLINRDLGFDHFRSFLNHHRVAEARRLLADQHRVGDKLIAIGLDSGFASLASFNRVFRAIEGCSPGHYRATALRMSSNEARASVEEPHADI